MEYKDAVGYLESFVNYERTHQPDAMRAVRLDRMRRLCRALGEPQRAFRAILVTGTNGKGSICAMLYAMLRRSALRVGLYTSPHLEHLRERVRVWDQGPDAPRQGHGDDWITEPAFADLMTQMRPCLERMRSDVPGVSPTYFEILTALAFLAFSHRRVEVAVLEVGLGGRLDATNVVDQAVSVIAPIDVDHADVLGESPAAIAREKAGVIKAGQTVITARQLDEVAAVLQETCEAHGVPLVMEGRDVTVGISRCDLDGLELSVSGLRGFYDGVRVPVVGRCQASNAALAVAALEALSTRGIPHSLVERGLPEVAWPGRMEVVQTAPLVLLDGAHNAHATAALAASLQELCRDRPLHLLVGMSADKSPEALGRQLGGLAASITCTKSAHPRALDPTELASRLAPYGPEVHVMADPLDAYTYVLNTVSPRAAIVVTGSLFLVGQLRSALRQAHVRSRKGALHADGESGMA